MQRFPGENKRRKEMTASINAANFLMLSTFGIAAVGYLLGRITIKGISLGTAGVFRDRAYLPRVLRNALQFQICH